MSTTTAPNIATKTSVVQARNVSKIFKRDAFEVKALDDVSIEIGTGEFLALMGPSGSGKTTLLNMIAAIDRPTSGQLLILGQNIFTFNDPIGVRLYLNLRLHERASLVESSVWQYEIVPLIGRGD